MAANEKTSKKVGFYASLFLRQKGIPKNMKSVFGSALTQMPDRKQPAKKKK